MEIESLSYPDAVRFLAKRAGLDVPEDPEYQSRYRKQERLWALCQEAARFFHGTLYSPCWGGRAPVCRTAGAVPGDPHPIWGGICAQSVGRSARGHGEKGGYTEEELLDAGLVLRSEKSGNLYDRFRNRLMFPIIDVRGHVIGFGGRVMDDSTPKYLNSPETLIFNKRKNLFAMNLAKNPNPAGSFWWKGIWTLWRRTNLDLTAPWPPWGRR